MAVHVSIEVLMEELIGSILKPYLSTLGLMIFTFHRVMLDTSQEAQHLVIIAVYSQKLPMLE